MSDHELTPEQIEAAKKLPCFAGNPVVTSITFISIRATITGVDGIVYMPRADIFWNPETMQLDTRYEGPVSDAVKILMDTFAEELMGMLS